MLRRFWLPLIGIWFVFPTAAQENWLNVVATYSILADVVQNVAGNNIELIVLVGANGDTHSYEPIPEDSVSLSEADIIFENGLGFESWLDDLYSASGSSATRVVISDGITPGTIPIGDEAGETDPHIWQDIYNFVHVTEIVRNTLSSADPANAVTYQINANHYLQQLLDVDTYILQQVQTLPADQHKIVTDHDAFGYFASRYGLEIVGSALGSVSTEGAEPSAADTAALVDAIRETGTRAIFPENIENADLVNQIAQEAGVIVGPALCSDALTPADGPCPTYVDMMRYNVDSIVGALSR
jgi:zinc/manganese transport system substrate-binding protein